MHTQRNLDRNSCKTSDIEGLTLASTTGYDKPKGISSDREIKRRLYNTRKNRATSNGVSSIPFKREEDDIDGVGPGAYDPGTEFIHRKAPATKIMKSNQTNEKNKKNHVQGLLKDVIKSNSQTSFGRNMTHGKSINEYFCCTSWTLY